MRVQVKAHMSLESSQLGLQLLLTPHLNQRFAQEVMDLQNARSPNFGNFTTPDLGVLKKMTFRCKPCA